MHKAACSSSRIYGGLSATALRRGEGEFFPSGLFEAGHQWGTEWLAGGGPGSRACGLGGGWVLLGGAPYMARTCSSRQSRSGHGAPGTWGRGANDGGIAPLGRGGVVGGSGARGYGRPTTFCRRCRARGREERGARVHPVYIFAAVDLTVCGNTVVLLAPGGPGPIASSVVRGYHATVPAVLSAGVAVPPRPAEKL